MAVNPAGFVPIFDFGNPKIITGRATAAITGGQLCFFSGLADAFSSGANSFTNGEMLVVTGASGLTFNGIAINTAASGEDVGIATGVAALVTSAGTITAGLDVIANGADAVVAGGVAGKTIGKALSAAGSEGYCLVQLK